MLYDKNYSIYNVYDISRKKVTTKLTKEDIDRLKDFNNTIKTHSDILLTSIYNKYEDFCDNVKMYSDYNEGKGSKEFSLVAGVMDIITQ